MTNPSPHPLPDAGLGSMRTEAEAIVFAWIRSDACGPGLKMMLGRPQVQPLVDELAAALAKERTGRDSWCAHAAENAVAADAAEATIARLTKRVEELEAGRDIDEQVDPFWTKVIGGTYKPSGAGIPIKHIHPAHVKPVFEAHRGTVVADVIAALLFRGMMAWNNARHAWDVAERAEAALGTEAQRAAAQDAVEDDGPATPVATPDLPQGSVSRGGDDV